MLSVLLVNEFDSENIGDQALTLGLEQTLLTVAPGAVRFSRLGLETCLTESHKKPGAAAGGGAQSTAKESHRSQTNGTVLSLLIFIAWCGRYMSRLWRQRKKILSADLIVLGGGSIIMNNKFHFPAAIFMVCLMARFYKVKYGFTGISVGGVITPQMRWALRTAFSRASFVQVRDPNSKEKIEAAFNMEVSCYADYAFGIQYPHRYNPGDDEATIVINVSENATGMSHARYEEYLQACDRIGQFFSATHHIKLITTGWPSDSAPLFMILESLKKSGKRNVSFVIPSSIEEYFESINHSQLVIASRLHAGIMSMIAGVPSMVLAVGEKQVGFFRGIGFHDSILELADENIIGKIKNNLDSSDKQKNDISAVKLQQLELCRAAMKVAVSTIT